MVRASIDLGTNTCLLLIAEVDAQGIADRVLVDHSNIVRLGEGVDSTRRLSTAAIDRTLVVLKKYAERVRTQGLKPEDIVAVGTSASRDAQNGKEFYERVKNETGIRFRVLSGDEEAIASFNGSILPGMDPDQTAVIDVGGGSTEIISHDQQGKLIYESLDIGSVRLTERFLHSDPVTDQAFWKCQESIDIELEKLFEKWGKKEKKSKSMIAVAGTATTLASWFLGLSKFDASKIDGCFLTKGDLHRQVEELKWRSVEERCAIPGMEKARADVLLAGAMILWRNCEIREENGIVVSTRGLRYGLFST